LWTIALKGVLNQWNVIGDTNDIVLSRAVSKGRLNCKRKEEERTEQNERDILFLFPSVEFYETN
jgi:hypothetical protein